MDLVKKNNNYWKFLWILREMHSVGQIAFSLIPLCTQNCFTENCLIPYTIVQGRGYGKRFYIQFNVTLQKSNICSSVFILTKQGHGLTENKFLLLLWTNINKCSTERIDSSHKWLQFQSVPWPVSPLLHNINWPQLHFFITIGFSVSIRFVRVSHESIRSWRKVSFFLPALFSDGSAV